MAYKGDFIQLLACLRLGIPHALLGLLVAPGALVWVPWRRPPQPGRMVCKTWDLEPV
jgi:hypothetical protein